LVKRKVTRDGLGQDNVVLPVNNNHNNSDDDDKDHTHDKNRHHSHHKQKHDHRHGHNSHKHEKDHHRHSKHRVTHVESHDGVSHQTHDLESSYGKMDSLQARYFDESQHEDLDQHVSTEDVKLTHLLIGLATQGGKVLGNKFTTAHAAATQPTAKQGVDEDSKENQIARQQALEDKLAKLSVNE